MPRDELFYLSWQGHLRYVDGQCWFDDGQGWGHCSFPLINGVQGVQFPSGTVDFDGQRVNILVQFPDEVVKG